MDIRDPIVIDPPNFNLRANWAECNQYAANVMSPDGEVNWAAAFSADPGCNTCPKCKTYYWAWGNRQRCIDCGFEYPTNWWSNYSRGVLGAKHPKCRGASHDEAMKCPYYRYGYEHPVEDAWAEHDQIDWASVI